MQLYQIVHRRLPIRDDVLLPVQKYEIASSRFRHLFHALRESSARGALTIVLDEIYQTPTVEYLSSLHSV